MFSKTRVVVCVRAFVLNAFLEGTLVTGKVPLTYTIYLLRACPLNNTFMDFLRSCEDDCA